MDTSGGKPIQAPPVSVKPLSSFRRDTLARLVITCDMRGPFFVRKLPAACYSNYKFLKLELRILKAFQSPRDKRMVGGRLHAPSGVAEVLLHHAFLALRRLR